ncbi:hypothetical protein EDB83DRAFT_1404111 [Lactarius deliciosus]|nr:hypothetical protein EDB83DRAFT_1404111 [Lactarius deliciosus]
MLRHCRTSSSARPPCTGHGSVLLYVRHRPIYIVASHFPRKVLSKFLSLDTWHHHVSELASCVRRIIASSLAPLLVSKWRGFFLYYHKTPMAPFSILGRAFIASALEPFLLTALADLGPILVVLSPTRATCTRVHGHKEHMRSEFDLKSRHMRALRLGALCSHVRPTATTPGGIANQPGLMLYVTIHIVGPRNTAEHVCLVYALTNRKTIQGRYSGMDSVTIWL